MLWNWGLSWNLSPALWFSGCEIKEHHARLFLYLVWAWQSLLLPLLLKHSLCFTLHCKRSITLLALKPNFFCSGAHVWSCNLCGLCAAGATLCVPFCCGVCLSYLAVHVCSWNNWKLCLPCTCYMELLNVRQMGMLPTPKSAENLACET